MKMSKFYDFARDGISQSILSGFLKCRKYAFLHLEGYQKDGGGSYSMDFGTFFHEVKGIIYARDTRPSKQEIKLEVNRYRKKAEIKDKQMVGIVSLLLVEYVRFWERDFTEGKWFGMESEFAIDFLGYKGLMRGKRDGLRKIHGKVWLKETKTKGRISSWAIQARLPIDFQCLLYMWATWKERLKAKKKRPAPAGVVYDVIRNPGEGKKKSESLKQYLKRLKADIRKRPEFYFMRFESPIEESDLVLFEKQLTRIVKDFIKWRQGKLKTYLNPYACESVYGLCSFIEACANKNMEPYVKREAVHNELQNNKANRA